jgi:hypothetical protein
MSEAEDNIQRYALPALKRLMKLLEQNKPVAFILWTNEPSNTEENCCNINSYEGGTDEHLIGHLILVHAEDTIEAIGNADEDDGDIDDDLVPEGQA